MKLRFRNGVLAFALAAGLSPAYAAFQDIKVDLTNGNLLTETEIADKSLNTFGLAVAADGTVSRVAADDASAACTMTGKYHSDEHGWGNFSSTVKVDGPVKISMGTCAWGGDVTVKNAAGEAVASFNTNTGACFHNNKAENIAFTYYKGEATTLTVSGGSYTPYYAVEAIDPSTLVEDAEVKFSFGDYEGCGYLPAGDKVEIGKTFTIPANFTMYVAGKTLTGWSDGEKTYKAGEAMTVNAATTLTPVFTDNETTLAARKDAVTIKWDFQRKNGAPNVAWQNQDNLVWVAQAEVNGKVIDVALPFSTNPGKMANGNWNDWAQLNEGTTFKVPSCVGAVISIEAYNETPKTKVDGLNFPAGSKTPSQTIMSDAESVDLVIGGDGSYYRYIQVVLPYVAPNLSGKTYTDEPASVIWPFDNGETYATNIQVTPEGAFSITAFDPGENTYKRSASTTLHSNFNYTEFVSKNGGSDMLEWTVKPETGLTFTPTKVSFYISRDSTDGTGGDVKVKGVVGETTIDFATITPIRNNKTFDDDKHKGRADLTDQFNYTLTAEQQAALTSGEGFTLTFNNGFANTKGVFLYDVQIHGLLNGTVVEVNKYTVEAVTNLEGAATVSVYPKAPSYVEGSEVKISTAKNFGYKFVNWTDQNGKVVSDKTEFTYKVAENSVFTANYEKINTYALNYKVNGGANLYQVVPTPAPVVIDGKNMYEEGAKVTLKANSNEVIVFTNWSDGNPTAEIVITMDGDKEITAEYDAKDYIVAWDFYLSGNAGRPADFISADNDDVTLVLRNEAGDSKSWLDKSTQAAGGYESLPGAAVNWTTGATEGAVGEYYWQTRFNAAAFTDIKVKSTMLYNYNAYQKQNIDYSLDGENWTTVGTIYIEGSKKAVEGEFTLPAAANNQEQVFVRWISDKTSNVDGTSSKNDGIALGATYITGTAKLVNDGKAPVLVNQVPAEGYDNASINGKIILGFDEKVKVKAGAKGKLGNLEITPTVTGKSVMFEYKNLTYSSDYTFTLAAGSIMDLTDNALNEAITIHFSTKTRPAVEKALYDAVASNVDELVAAIAEANSRADKTTRYRIFIKDGIYKMPVSATATKEGGDGKTYPDPTTYISAPNISFIGESRDGVIITSGMQIVEFTGDYGPANVLEGLGKSDVVCINSSAKNTYWQDVTIKSAMGDSRGRDCELEDKSDKTIMKNVCLWGYQDTYYSHATSRFYFEGGVMRGRTDYLCGSGDVYCKGVTFRTIEGGYVTAPSTGKNFGYIFKECEIVGDNDNVDGRFTLGRPWGSGTPMCLWIDTKMTVKPSAAGWNEMSGGYPKRFAEYNSYTASGTVIDLSDRKKSFGDANKAGIFPNDPVLTKAEADYYSYERVMGGDDDWDPAADAEAAPAPTKVVIEDGVITWDDNDYVSLWAIVLNGKVVDFVTEPKYDTKGTRAQEVYAVRAANAMGGLGEAVVAGNGADSVKTVAADVVSSEYYTLEGIRVSENAEGVLLRVDTLANGEKVAVKVVVRK